MVDYKIKNLYSPKEIINSGLCIGCGACAGKSDISEIKMKFDREGQYKPVSDAHKKLKKDAYFSSICPFSPVSTDESVLAAELYPKTGQKHSATGNYLKAYVGFVKEDNYRLRGSSGGMVSWVLAELLKKNLIDGAAHVAAVADPQMENKFFRYRISRTEKDIRNGAKSRYYPVEMSEILEEIRRVPGRYAIVGVPCFIKAVQLLRRENKVFQERIKFTLGLFCGHFKSAQFVESLAWQMDVSVGDVKSVEFRYKDQSRPANWYNARLTLKDGSEVNQDWWHLADGDWGAGFFMNSACNFCDDVVAETADISFGDAWVEPYSSDGRGTNIIVTRSPAIESLLTGALAEKRLHLTEVDGDFVEATQAAGFRQRREGLAYRLTWRRGGVMPQKRVSADASSQTLRRKLIYRFRAAVSSMSHRVFRFARSLETPEIYIVWATAASKIYQGLIYRRGRIGKLFKIIGIK